MSINRVFFYLFLLLGMVLWVGCEIPSPNAEAPVPVNPDSVPAQNLQPTVPVDTGADNSETGQSSAEETPTGETGEATATGEGENSSSSAEAGTEADQAAEDGSAGTEGEATDQQSDSTDEQSTDAGSPREPFNYTVQAGDTLGSIAEINGLTVEELRAANNLANIHSLDVGQVLLIPLPGTTAEAAPPTETATEPAASSSETIHIVAYGDTLFNIGQRYGFTVEELQAHNGILNPARIDIGQEIRIPAR